MESKGICPQFPNEPFATTPDIDILKQDLYNPKGMAIIVLIYLLHNQNILTCDEHLLSDTTIWKNAIFPLNKNYQYSLLPGKLRPQLEKNQNQHDDIYLSTCWSPTDSML